MLGYVTLNDDSRLPGAGDRLLSDLAQSLSTQGLRVAGAVQDNIDHGADTACDMDLRILGTDLPPIRISQSLGPGATACRLDIQALTQAVAATQTVLDRGADIAIINKFGKQEAFGRGFRDVIASALAQDIPVLLCVPAAQQTAFLEFAGDLAVEVAPTELREWCLLQTKSRAA